MSADIRISNASLWFQEKVWVMNS